MLFNSVEFALFPPLVFGVYWMLNGKLRIQNAWIVLSSYVFYGWWSWEFLGLLGYFKYAGFFVQNWIDAWASLGIETNASTLKIILPVGISFHTFQTLSYSIDVYREKLKPSRDIVAFAGFVAFFPQLVAGPIERDMLSIPARPYSQQ
jgi:alginate O-acetyltransferase complex protein AlgI